MIAQSRKERIAPREPFGRAEAQRSEKGRGRETPAG
jgi:hypothetical protein